MLLNNNIQIKKTIKNSLCFLLTEAVFKMVKVKNQ